jgi:glutamine amidotransferase
LIAILDYGSGNLRSAQRAFATCGLDVVVTADRAVALEADGLVVPGVGAFAACMQGLQSVDGAAIIRERIANERPVLGICIGMQILFQEGSEHSENGNHSGVGVWEGEVSRLDAPILPHMGWNNIESDSNSTLFKGVAGESFYFVHSFAAKKAVGKMQGWSFHGEKFLAAVEDGYVSATQFHPEKSGDAGLALIANWVKSL